MSFLVSKYVSRPGPFARKKALTHYDRIYCDVAVLAHVDCQCLWKIIVRKSIIYQLRKKWDFRGCLTFDAHNPRQMLEDQDEKYICAQNWRRSSAHAHTAVVYHKDSGISSGRNPHSVGLDIAKFSHDPSGWRDTHSKADTRCVAA